MDDRRFDALTKRLATRVNRRGAIKGLLGLGGAAAVVSVLGESDSTEAQRRPTPTVVPPPQCPGNRVPCGSGCCCAPGFTTCGAECCPNGRPSAAITRAAMAPVSMVCAALLGSGHAMAPASRMVGAVGTASVWGAAA